MEAVGPGRTEYYARQYGQGKVSLARAAHGAGVSIWEMQSYVRELKIPAQYNREDLEHDLKTVYRRIEARS